MTEKDKAEWAVLRRFCELYQDCLPGNVRKAVQPDFIVDGGDSALGIEITELHKETPPGEVSEQANEAVKYGCVQRAQQLYEKKGGPTAWVYIHFCHAHLSGARAPVLADEIAKLVDTHMPAEKEVVDIESGSLPGLQLSPEIHSIRVRNVSGLADTLFQANAATRAGNITLQDIQRAVSSKEEKYALYRRHTASVWLLITCNAEFMSTWFQRTEAAGGFSVKTSFERIFLLSLFENRLIEIMTENGIAS